MVFSVARTKFRNAKTNIQSESSKDWSKAPNNAVTIIMSRTFNYK